MSKLTKEQYDLLHEKYSVAIMWAIKSNCVPAFSRSELEELKAIYMWLGHKLEDSHCGHCLLAMMQTIGKEYFEFEALLSKASEKKEVKEVSNERETNSSSDEYEECGVYEGCSNPGTDGEEARHEAETEEGAEDDSEKVASRRSRRRSNSKPNVREA